MSFFGFGHAPLSDLLRYRDGTLTSGERAQVETHLAGCEPCRAKQDFVHFIEQHYGETMSAVPATSSPHLMPAELAAYLDRSVRRRDRARIELHLAGCAECLMELMTVNKLLKQTSPVHPPAADLRTVLAMGHQPGSSRTTVRPQSLLAGVREWLWPEGRPGRLAWAVAGSAVVVALATFSVMQWSGQVAPADPLAGLMARSTSAFSPEQVRRIQEAGGLVAQVQSGESLPGSAMLRSPQAPPVQLPAPSAAMTATDWYRVGETGSALATPLIYVLLPKAALEKMTTDYEALLGKAQLPGPLQAGCRQAMREALPTLFSRAEDDYERAATKEAAPAVGSCLDGLFTWTIERRRQWFYLQLGYVNFHLYYLPTVWERAPEPIKQELADKLQWLMDVKASGGEALQELCPTVRTILDHMDAYAVSAADARKPSLSLEQGRAIHEEAVKLRTLILEGKHRC